ncbi:Uncharacterised protein [Vibrio cholerae]|nr:Uncharacterised protein [Vibrio cholerae]CSC31617.1 Uncharacterised protein [Vibrio cholerae]CSC61049.1 Uncharacterised protein [Vibrio cholerae]
MGFLKSIDELAHHSHVALVTLHVALRANRSPYDLILTYGKRRHRSDPPASLKNNRPVELAYGYVRFDRLAQNHHD